MVVEEEDECQHCQLAMSDRLTRAVSEVGRAAKFKTPEEEIQRILAHKTNYYICLKVRRECLPEKRGDFLLAASAVVAVGRK